MTPFVRSVELDPDDETALAGLIDAAGAGRRLADAQRVLETTVTARPESSAARLALARLLAAAGAFDAAVAHAEEAIAAEPDSPRGLESLASILGDAGDVDRLRLLVTRMQETHPEREETFYYAVARELSGRRPSGRYRPSAAGDPSQPSNTLPRTIWRARPTQRSVSATAPAGLFAPHSRLIRGIQPRT